MYCIHMTIIFHFAEICTFHQPVGSGCTRGGGGSPEAADTQL